MVGLAGLDAVFLGRPMRRRDFLAIVGAAVAWPFGARAQLAGMPVIGYLSGRSAESDGSMLVALRRGLGEAGFVEGRNAKFEYRFADGRYDRLSAQLTDLTQHKADVIVFVGFAALGDLVQRVRASPIPVVFNTGSDPVEVGLVRSINRPGGNATGVQTLVAALSGKHLSLLHDLVPTASTIAVLVDPRTPARDTAIRDARDSAAVLGQRLLFLTASTPDQIDAAFESLDREPAGAMLVTVSPFL